MIERLKFQNYHEIYADNYFWRTYDGSEVDLVGEREGKLFGFEFKWKSKKAKVKVPPKWKEYAGSSYAIIAPKI